MIAGELSALASALCWALSSVWLTAHTRRLDAITVNTVRCLVASAFFAVLLPFAGGLAALTRLSWANVAGLLGSVVLIIGVGDTLFFASMERIGASRALPVASANPLITLVLALVFLGEWLSPLDLAGAALTLGGVYLIVASPPSTAARRPADGGRVGLLMAVAAAGCWGVGTAVLKTGMSGINVIVANAVRQPAAALLLLGFMAVRGRSLAPVRRLSRRQQASLLAASLLASGIGSILFVYGIQYAGAAKGAILSNTTPLFGLPFSARLLRERLTPGLIAGTILSVIGVWMIVW